MRIMKTLLAGGAGLAALAAATPASAQYYSRYSNPYPAQYGYNAYGYAGVNSNVAAQQCTAAVQNRLYNRTSVGSILGSIVGLPTNVQGRVLSVTAMRPTEYGMRIRGLASSGRYASNGYGPYGVGAYGAVGYNYAGAADLTFRCDVDNRGYVRDIDIRRR